MGNCIDAEFGKDMDGRTLTHRFRYHLAKGFVTKEDVVLDAACGKGYGSVILSDGAKKVIGVDFVEAEIEGAKVKQARDNISYECHNLEEWDIPAVDVAVSIETIEHLYDPQSYINKLKARVKKFIVGSVPIGETLIEVDGDVQIKGDPTHHYAFPSPAHLDNMFVDNNWRRFYGFRSGVNYLAVYYNNEGA